MLFTSVRHDVVQTPTVSKGRFNEMKKSEKTSKRAVALGLTAGLVGGGAAGLVLGVPGLTSAADSDRAGVVVSQTEPDPGTDTETPARPDPGERMRESLQPLVDAGTISGEQADAVADHLGSQIAERVGQRGRRGGPGGPFGQAGGSFGAATALTEVLGMEPDELREAVRSGSTIAEIAEATGVAVDDVVAAMVAEATERLDDAVANGRIDADEAAEKTEMIEERVTAQVNGDHPAFGRRPGHSSNGSPTDGDT
jgi:polyhydroxyalkanoate synthesis regulator phasin